MQRDKMSLSARGKPKMGGGGVGVGGQEGRRDRWRERDNKHITFQ